MIYEANVKEVSLCGCGYEGHMLIELNHSLLKAYYQAPATFIEEYIISKTDNNPKGPLEYKIIQNNKPIFPIDLWLVFGSFKIW